MHRRLLVEQGAEVAAFVVQRHGAAVVFRHQGRASGRMLLRATEQVALDQVDAHLGQHRQLFRQLDAFGDHLCA
jgi:hypothetical protein